MVLLSDTVYGLDIRHVKVNNGHFELDQVEIFQDASSTETSHFVLC